MQGNLIVAHFKSGAIQKGLSLDVDVKRPACHLKTEAGTVVEVKLAEMKALFFVKSATGRPQYHESTEAVPGDTRLVGAKRVRMTFADGETILGLMNRFPPITPFFFMLPIDPASNNIRILVNKAAVKDMREVPS